MLGSHLIGCTVMRIRGLLSFFETNVPPAGPNAVAVRTFAWGIHVANGAHVAAPAANQPNPLSTMDTAYADWMGYGISRLFAPSTDLNDRYGSGSYQHFEIDIRARRRLDEIGDTLQIIVGADAAAGGNWQTNLSILIALP